MRQEQFERMYTEHAGPLLAFLVYRTGDRVLSEDLVADTFERVLTTRRGFERRRGSEKTWLYTIALNLLRDHARHEAAGARATQRIAAGHSRASPTGGFQRVEQRDELQAAMATLSEEEREAVALRFGADMTVPEIASLKRDKLTTIEGRVYRALRKLRDQLE
jgi:RNA polymerase sigma-70 factor (ECF subfamily)